MSRQTKSGFTLVELLVVIAIIGILISLLFPAFIAVRNSARSTQCKSNLRSIALGLLARASNNASGAYCSGAFDPDRDGSVEDYGWVADCVKQEIFPSTLLCPSSSCQTSEKISTYLDPSNPSSSSKGPPARRNSGLYAQMAGTALTGDQVATQLFEKGYNTNYATSWFLVRSAPLFDSSSPAGTLESLKEWWKDIGGTPTQITVGPLTTNQLDAGGISASRIAIMGCGAVGDRNSTAGGGGDGALNGSIPAPYNIPAGSPCAESFNDGPSFVDADGTIDFAPKAGGITRTELENYTPLTIGDAGVATGYRQDTRDMYAYHASSLNVAFADGSVRNFTDENGDGFINPGFDPTIGGSPSVATHGYTSAEVEVNVFDWYTGVFLDADFLEKSFEQ